MYGNEQETTCEPIPDADLAQQLHAAIQNIDGSYKRIEIPEKDIDDDRTLPADPDVRNFSYTLADGQVYYRENSIMTKPNLSLPVQERIKGLIALRDCTRRLIDAQMSDEADDTIHQLQGELNRLYDDFTVKHGLINERPIIRLFHLILPIICCVLLRCWTIGKAQAQRRICLRSAPFLNRSRSSMSIRQWKRWRCLSVKSRR